MIGIFIFKVLYLYLIGFVLAILEIQIEGKHGWAEKLPAWRPAAHSKLGRWWLRLTKKDLTGYHLSMAVFLLLFLHLPFIWLGSWNWQGELEILAFYFALAVFWDFLWFVLNPQRSLRDFNKANVWWHRHWWGKFPADYYMGLLAVIVMFIPLIVLDPTVAITKLLILIFGIIFLTAVTVLFYPRAY